jgi:hypothetical protein
MEYDNDIQDIEATSGTNYSGVYYQDYTGTTRDPKMTLTIQENAIMLGANF